MGGVALIPRMRTKNKRRLKIIPNKENVSISPYERCLVVWNSVGNGIL